jgi:hypothetical protein
MSEGPEQYDSLTLVAILRSRGWLCFRPAHGRILLPEGLIIDLKQLVKNRRNDSAARMVLHWMSNRLNLDLTCDPSPE